MNSFDNKLEQLGKILNKARIEKGYSTRKLAELSKVASNAEISMLENAKRLKSNGESNTSVWLKNGRFIVRTPLKIISPASNSFVSSAEGNMNVYVINQVPQLRGIIDGKIVSVNISGY